MAPKNSYFVLLLLLCFGPMQALVAQDELYFKGLAGGPKAKTKNYWVEVASPRYLMDINGDGKPEGLSFVRRDGESWLEIKTQDGKESLLSFKFDGKGLQPELYKVDKRSLDQNTEILVLYFFEGATRYLDVKASARFYFLTVDKHDLKSMKVFKGPVFWQEEKLAKADYRRRLYEYSLIDLNRDGTREVMVKNRLISQVYRYLGAGKWQTL